MAPYSKRSTPKDRDGAATAAATFGVSTELTATDRMNTQIDAQEAGATINYKRVDTMGKELDNAAKIQELRMPKMSVADMSDEDLFKQLAG